MNFGQAFERIKEGEKVARKNWNGEAFVYFVPGGNFMSTTEIAKKYFGVIAPYKDHIAMKTADDEVVPWVVSQVDMLAEDWIVIQ